MNKYYFILSFIFVFLISCTKKETVLNQIIIVDESLIAQNDTLVISNTDFKRTMNSDYTYNVNGKLYKRGKYENSKKVGFWKYKLSNRNSEIDTFFIWRELQNQNLSLSIPSSWKTINKPDSATLFIFDLKPDLERDLVNNNYLIVIEHDKGSKSSTSFNDYYNQQIKEQYQLNGSDNFEITLNDKLIGYFNRYVVDSKYYIIDYNFENNESVYEITMKVDYEKNQSLPQLVFFEFIRTISIDNALVIDRKGKLDIKYKE